MSEPLRNKEHHKSTGYDYETYFSMIDIKSAVEFYKKYHNDTYSSEGYELLKKEKPDIYKKFTDFILTFRVCGCIYNYWLYEYCFDDVIE